MSKKTYNIFLAVLMVCLFLAPVNVNALPDNPPTSSLSANDLSPDSVAVLTAVSVDTLANAGVEWIKVYEDGNLIGTKQCNLYSSCVYVKTVTHNSAGSHDYYSVAKDRAGQTRQSSTISLTFGGDNQPPVITSKNPSSPVSGVLESQGVTLSFTAQDPDNSASELTYEWYLNGNLIAGETGTSMHFQPQVNQDTTYTIGIKVKDPLGGQDVDGWTVQIIDEPTTVSVDANPNPVSECNSVDLTANAQSNAGIANYAWTFGDSTSDSGASLAQVTHSYPGNDTYTATVTVTDNDQRTAQDTVDVVVEDDAPEVTILAPTEWPVGQSVNFSSDVVDSCLDTMVNWEWDFGDNSNTVSGPVPVQDQSHIYATEGVYTVSLTVCDSDSCTTALHDINITYVGPDADFDYDPTNPIEGEDVNFTDTTTSDDPIVSWEWDFDGDGVTDSTQQNPTHDFDQEGNYSVTLTVTDDEDLSDSHTEIITVGNNPPVIDFTSDIVDGEEPLTVAFTCTYTDGNEPVELVINFGDGSPLETSQEPVTVNHTYQDDNQYTATCTVTDFDNDQDSADITIDVYDSEPVGDWTWDPEPSVEGETIDFNATVTAHDGIALYEWDFDGDGVAESTAEDPSWSFSEEGNYTVTLTVTDGDGSELVIPHDVTVLNNPPTADLIVNATTGMEALTVEFICLVYDGNTPYQSVVLDFGDGTQTGVVAGNPILYTYQQNGTYDASCTVIDADGDSNTENEAITVFDSVPVVSFTYDPQDPKENEPVDFNSTISAYDQPVTILWDFGDGETSVDPNPTHAYDTDGTYLVNLTVTDADGSSVSFTDTVIVDTNAPDVTLDANPMQGPEGTIVDFTCTWADGNAPFEWYIDFGDGSPWEYNQTTVSHEYTTENAYTATCHVDDTDGDFGEDQVIINIDNNVPVMTLSVNPEDGDEALEVSAVCSVVDGNGPFDYVIDWDDGSPLLTGDDEAPTFGGNHTYVQQGNYTITCDVVDFDGDPATDSVDVEVYDTVPTAMFTFTPVNPTEGDAVDFDQTIDGYDQPLSWLWDFGDGTTSTSDDPSHAYPLEGQYNVTLTVTDNDGSQVVVWNLVDVSNNAPFVNLDATPVNGPENTNVTFDCQYVGGNEPVQSAVLDFGDGTPTSNDLDAWHVYTVPGSYLATCTVVDADGDIDSDTLVINIDNNPPVIDSFDANPNPSTEGQDVDFDCQVSGGDDPLVYVLDFGDGTLVGTNPQETHAYANEGIYTASCLVTDGDGDFAIQELLMNVTNNPPIVNLVANNTNDYEPLDVEFTCNVGGGNVPMSYEIDFGDGSPVVNSDTATHTYPVEGNWVATCTVTDVDGDVGSDDEQIVVLNNPPVINFIVDPTTGTEGDKVDFDCQISGGNDPMVVEVGYGEGTTTAAEQSSFTYALEGNYTAYCDVTDNDGDHDRVEQVVEITNNPPIVDVRLNTTSGLEPLDVNTTCDIGAGNSPFDVWIDFGDGSAPVNTDTATHSYPTPGHYNITCEVTDIDGDFDTDIETVYVIDNPPVITLFDVTPTTGPEGQDVYFDCQTTGGNDPLSYVIDFGDGTQTSNAQEWHNYPLEGVFNTSCTVTDLDGDVDVEWQLVNITNNAPVVNLDANVTSGSEPLTVDFTCNVGGGNTPLSYVIDFGDGTPTVTTDTATHTYPNPGVYDATCTVTDVDLDVGTDTLPITVLDNAPVINWVVSPTSGPEGTDVDFDCQVTGGNAPLTYTLNFGDGSATSSLSVDDHVYPLEGVYNTTCTVVDNDGDTTQEWQLVNITNNVPVVSLQSNVTSGDEPLDVYFTCAVGGGNAPYSYSIDFDDGTPAANSDTAAHTYAVPGTYDAVCTVVDTDGDVGADTQTISVADDTPAVTLVATPTTGPEGQTVDFDCQVSGGNAPFSYLIKFGDGTTASSETAQHTYPLEGQYNASCTVTDNDADVGTDSQIIDIYNFPPVANIIPNVSVALEPETIFFNCTVGDGNPPFSYVMDFGDGSAQVTTNTGTHTYVQQGDYLSWCQVTDTDGDVDTDYDWINISDTIPTAFFNYSSPVVEGQGVTFYDQSTAYDGISVWSWDFDNDGIEDSNLQNPTYVFLSDGTYTVSLTVTDGDGSQDTYSELVTVLNDAPVVSLTVVPDSGDEPLSTTVTCTVTSGGNAPFVYNILYGDGDSTSSPVSAHSYDQDGIYGAICTVTDNDGDVGMDTVNVNVTDTTPTADFSWTPLLPGTSDTVDFTDLSVPGHDAIVAWSWDFDGDGVEDDNAQNPSFNFTSDGDYDVNLTVTDADGSQSWVMHTVTVNSTPGAPLILNIQVVGLSNESATITWATNQPADSLLEWGLTNALGLSDFNASLAYNHSVTLTGLTESTLYYFNITSCNSLAECATNGVMNFTTLASNDLIPPAPVSGLGESSVGDTWIDWSWTNPTDADFDHVEIWIDGVYVTDVTGTSYNATGFLPGTSHNIEVITVDTMGNRNAPGVADSAATTGSTGDILAPVVVLTAPADASVDADGDVTVQWFVTDETATTLSCIPYSDRTGVWGPDFAVLVPNATTGSSTWNGMTDGTYTWNVLCDDGTNTAWAPANWTFTVNTTVVDTVPPTVTLVSPPDTYVDADGNISILYNVVDDMAGTLTCDIYSNTSGAWQADVVGQVTANATGNTFDYNNLPDGSYLWNVECDDGTNSAFAAADFTFDVNTSGSGSSVPAVVAMADVTNGNAPLTVNFDAVVVGGDLPLTFAWDFDNDGTTDSTAQSPSHTYVSAGTYNASVEVCDADLDCDSDYTIIVVGSVANRDIAVLSMTYDKLATTTYLWDNVEVNASVQNQGDVTELVAVDLEADGVVVDTTVISIDPGMTELVTLNWASAAPDGWRNLEVRANPVIGESDLSDQSQSDTVQVWSVDDLVSNATRELFLNETNVAIGDTFKAMLPVQNDYALENFDNLRAELSYDDTAFTVLSPAVVQNIDLPAGNLVVVTWDVQANGPASNYAFSASLGNNEITSADIIAKSLTVA